MLLNATAIADGMDKCSDEIPGNPFVMRNAAIHNPYLPVILVWKIHLKEEQFVILNNLF